MTTDLSWPQQVRQLIAGMEPADQAMLQLCYFERLTTERIAEMMNMSVASVRRVRARAMKRFSLLLTAQPI